MVILVVRVLTLIGDFPVFIWLVGLLNFLSLLFVVFWLLLFTGCYAFLGMALSFNSFLEYMLLLFRINGLPVCGITVL